MTDNYCLRCGHEGHTADECKRPIPAWPNEAELLPAPQPMTQTEQQGSGQEESQ